MLYSRALTLNLTLVLGYARMDNSVVNPLRCLCYSQAYLPLSYAAQIPTTSNPDLANVHLSLLNLDQEVRKCSV